MRLPWHKFLLVLILEEELLRPRALMIYVLEWKLVGGPRSHANTVAFPRIFFLFLRLGADDL